MIHTMVHLFVFGYEDTVMLEKALKLVGKLMIKSLNKIKPITKFQHLKIDCKEAFLCAISLTLNR